MERIRFAARLSRSVLMTGMVPPTLASNPMSTPPRSAALKISSPWVASSALLAVTTCLPCRIASRIKLLAGSQPPISSMTIEISGSFRMAFASRVSSFRSTATGRGVFRSRSAIREMTIFAPMRFSMRPPLSMSSFTVPEPILPNPISPALMIFIGHAPVSMGLRHGPQAGG